MNEYIETAKKLAPFISLAKPLIDTILKPKLKSLENWLKERRTDNEVYDYYTYETKFQEYILRTIEKCSIINTLIFPNQQIKIEDIYQPLTLIDNNFSAHEKIKIESFPQELFVKYQKVLITDSAGMGKSTLSRYICLKTIQENQGIPVFIELRKITRKNTILQEIHKQLNPIDKVFDTDFIIKLLKAGEFLVIFDGFDEIINEEREIVTHDIREFVSKCSENNFLLTSRPEGTLTAFGDFKITNIQGLLKTEAYELFQKYDKIGNTNLSNSLIKEIRGVNNQVAEFLVNPFLVSLLYKTYSFKRDIPSRKSTFYNEVYTALYQDHDLSKDCYKRDKVSKLDIQDFRLVLREFSDYTAKKGEIEYDRPKATQYISICKKRLPFLEFKESSFIEDLLTTVPIFTTEGNNIKWAHKSFQDYFAAEYITYHPKKNLIINHLIDKDVRKYQNIIDLIIELDPNLIRQYVLPNILRDLIKHFDGTYKLDNVKEEDLAIRRMITFDTKFWINKVVIKGAYENKQEMDEFERTQEYIKSRYGNKYESATKYNEEYLVAYSTTNRAIFLQLIGNKGILGESILKYQTMDSPSNNLFEKNPVLVSDKDIQLPYNLPAHFDKFNKILTETYNSSFRQNRIVFLPDIKFCKDLLKSIEEEIENTKTENFLDEY